jgi:hypothetical protein
MTCSSGERQDPALPTTNARCTRDWLPGVAFGVQRQGV